MRGAILWIGKQKSGAALPIFKSLLDQFKQEEIESVGELQEVRSQIVLKCLYLARIGIPDILWLVHKLARSVTKWTQARDRRLIIFISYIHHKNEFWQYCHVGNTAQHCRLVFFQDSDFAGDFEDSKSFFRESLVYLQLYQYPAILQNLKSFRWMLDYVWMGYLLLIFGILWLKFYVQPTTLSKVPKWQKKAKDWSIVWRGLRTH